MGMGGIGKNQRKNQDICVGVFSIFLHFTAYSRQHQLLCICIFSNRIQLLMVLYENTVLEITEIM
jgi:hypothetical protein